MPWLFRVCSLKHEIHVPTCEYWSFTPWITYWNTDVLLEVLPRNPSLSGSPPRGGFAHGLGSMASSEGRQVSLQPVSPENLLRRFALPPLLSEVCFFVVLFEMSTWFSFLAFVLHRIREFSWLACVPHFCLNLRTTVAAFFCSFLLFRWRRSPFHFFCWISFLLLW